MKALPRLSFYDASTGLLVSKGKAPRDLKGFAKLNKPAQSHLIAQTFDPEVAGILFSEHSLNILRKKSVYKIAYIGSICAKIGLFSLLASNSHSSSANYKVIGFGAAGASAGSRPSANYFIIVLGFGLLLTL